MLPSAPSVGGVSTGNVADLPLTFSNVTFQALNDGAMQVLFQAVTDTPGGDLTLAGTANVTVKTTSGDIPIGDIAFNVPSSLAGALINNIFDEIELIRCQESMALAERPDYLGSLSAEVVGPVVISISSLLSLQLCKIRPTSH